MVLNSSLDDRLAPLCRVPQLLIACDYDGTLAPITSDPMRAVPRRESAVALRALADLDQTEVAVISGRALRDLAALSRLPNEIRLIGSHGSEFDVGFSAKLSGEAIAVRNELQAQMRQIADRFEGALLES